MNISPLAEALTSFLVPLLPHLVRMGEEESELAGEKLAGARWQDARRLWRRLGPLVAETPETVRAGEAAVTLPENPEVQDTLATRLEALLESDPELAGELERVLDPGRVTSGYEVVPGGNVSEGTVVGDSDHAVTISLSGDENEI
ncbi:MAG TPA: hypothetical protein VEL74_08440 [Thermoanaerobaculia bacterium]|nr:hypothetical protein [Thermoanaerobaculia bacterium]